jgi:hypothetical protein
MIGQEPPEPKWKLFGWRNRGWAGPVTVKGELLDVTRAYLQMFQIFGAYHHNFVLECDASVTVATISELFCVSLQLLPIIYVMSGLKKLQKPLKISSIM